MELIYFITKCFFKDRFIFVIQQFFVKKGPVPEKASCSPPLLLVYSTIKVRMTFCSLDPAAEGERSRGGKSEISPPLLVKWFPLLLLLFKQVSCYNKAEWAGVSKCKLAGSEGGKVERSLKYSKWQWQFQWRWYWDESLL